MWGFPVTLLTPLAIRLTSQIRLDRRLIFR
jgi:hypothetical protein